MRPIVNSENTRFPDEAEADTPGPQVAREAFLAAMRQVAATVTVVTTDGPAGRAGATVSAFTSLSADPPAVLICLRSDSQIAQAVQENGVFCVNILPEDADATARAFTGRPNDSAESRFDGIALRETAHGPLLPRATSFACRLVRRDIHGSHAICVGEVESLVNAGEMPLAYMNGAFHVVRRKGAAQIRGVSSASGGRDAHSCARGNVVMNDLRRHATIAD